MNYHFIGIGGISMSGIARYLKIKGHKIDGCDLVRSKTTDALSKEGIDVKIGHSPSHITSDFDRVVYNIRVTSGPGKIEINKAQQLGIVTIDRLKLISELVKNKISIAIAGMHGKTTTTAMLGQIIQDSGQDPDILLGGNFGPIGGNVRVGRGQYFIYEACEYDPAFLDLAPNFAIITNIEEEHLDRFKDLDEILATFQKFITHIKSKGILVFSGDDPNIQKIIKSARCQVLSYGFQKNNDFIIKKINQQKFKLKSSDQTYEFELVVPGQHNVADAAAAAIVSSKLGVAWDQISQSLKKFSGVDRRIQIKRKLKDVIIIDDYAHNPTEISATLKAIREFYPGKKIQVVFRPSQYSRNQAFLNEYGRSFESSDKVIILKTAVPPGKEAEPKKVTSQELVDEIQKNGQDAIYLIGFDEVLEYFEKEQPKGILITMGLGNVYELAEKLVNKLE